jgi:hypothetical protein
MATVEPPFFGHAHFSVRHCGKEPSIIASRLLEAVIVDVAQSPSSVQARMATMNCKAITPKLNSQTQSIFGTPRAHGGLSSNSYTETRSASHAFVVYFWPLT